MEHRMSDRTAKWGLLVALAAAALVGALGGEWYHHLSVKPVALPTLLFEVLEVVLVVGCVVIGTLVVLHVRVPEMVVAAAAMLAVLLTGELYLGVGPIALRTLLLEVLEVILVVGGAIAFALLALRVSGTSWRSSSRNRASD
jgi:hypothetical protein